METQSPFNHLEIPAKEVEIHCRNDPTSFYGLKEIGLIVGRYLDADV